MYYFTLQSDHGKKGLARTISWVYEFGQEVDVVAAVKTVRPEDRADEILVPQLGRDHDRVVARFIFWRTKVEQVNFFEAIFSSNNLASVCNGFA